MWLTHWQESNEASLSPSSVWQVEFVNPTLGAAITYGKPIRFRHINGLYLCVVVTTVASQSPSHRSPPHSRARARSESDTDTTYTYTVKCVRRPTPACDFTLHPSGFDKPDADEAVGFPIPLSRHGLFVRHCHTKLWLHATGSRPKTWKIAHNADPFGAPRPSVTLGRSPLAGQPFVPDDMTLSSESSGPSADDAGHSEAHDGGDGSAPHPLTGAQASWQKLRRVTTAATWVSYYDEDAKHEYYYDPESGTTAWTVRVLAVTVVPLCSALTALTDQAPEGVEVVAGETAAPTNLERPSLDTLPSHDDAAATPSDAATGEEPSATVGVPTAGDASVGEGGGVTGGAEGGDGTTPDAQATAPDEAALQLDAASVGSSEYSDSDDPTGSSSASGQEESKGDVFPPRARARSSSHSFPRFLGSFTSAGNASSTRRTSLRGGSFSQRHASISSTRRGGVSSLPDEPEEGSASAQPPHLAKDASGNGAYMIIPDAASGLRLTSNPLEQDLLQLVPCTEQHVQQSALFVSMVPYVGGGVVTTLLDVLVHVEVRVRCVRRVLQTFVISSRLHQDLTETAEEEVSHVLGMLTQFCIENGEDDDTIVPRGEILQSVVTGTPNTQHQQLLEEAGLVRLLWPGREQAFVLMTPPLFCLSPRWTY